MKLATIFFIVVGELSKLIQWTYQLNIFKLFVVLIILVTLMTITSIVTAVDYASQKHKKFNKCCYKVVKDGYCSHWAKEKVDCLPGYKRNKCPKVVANNKSTAPVAAGGTDPCA